MIVVSRPVLSNVRGHRSQSLCLRSEYLGYEHKCLRNWPCGIALLTWLVLRPEAYACL